MSSYCLCQQVVIELYDAVTKGEAFSLYGIKNKHFIPYLQGLCRFSASRYLTDEGEPLVPGYLCTPRGATPLYIPLPLFIYRGEGMV